MDEISPGTYHQKKGHDHINITSGMKEIQIPNSRTGNHGHVNIIPSAEEMTTPKSRRPNHGSITNVSVGKEIQLCNFTTLHHNGEALKRVILLLFNIFGMLYI
jgi:hypothetical protein